MNPTNTSGGQNPAGQISPIITSVQILPNSIKQAHLYNVTMNKGDLYYGKDGSNFTNLPIGKTGQVLTAQNNVPSWTSNGAWQTPGLLNSWVAYGSGFATAQYMKDTIGFVHLQGTVKSGTIGDAIFQLPAGYRPLSPHYYPNVVNAGLGYTYVDSSGNVVAASGNNTAFFIDGISFLAEQ